MSRGRTVRSGFEQRLLAALRAAGVGPGLRLTVGFSGGVDSLALALALSRLRPKLAFEILLVHVDHGLRAGSRADAEMARQLAAELAVPFRLETLPARLSERAPGFGIEEAARQERYLALAIAAQSWDSSNIVLAHQAGDQAETVLLHLFRGAGLHGLAGMRLSDCRPIPWWDPDLPMVGEFTVLRPMLGELRSTIESYVAESDLEPVIDESNAEEDFDRNWIRLKVLPAILERWPAAILALSDHAALAGAGDRFIESWLSSSPAFIATSDRTLCTDTLQSLPPSLAYRILRRWLTELGVRHAGLRVVERVHSLVTDADQSRIVEAGNRISVVRDDNRLTTLERLIQNAADSMPIEGMDGSCGWDIRIGGHFEPASAVVKFPTHESVEIRCLRHGDRWWGSDRSVFDDLRAAGVHPLLRERVLAIVSSAGVLLIPAIYPTIHSGVHNGVTKTVEVQWRRVAAVN